jgi:1-pyrroline-5-carboxylate dehydrogenase
LEGFIFAITPFNFTSIAGNLPTAPALMGNTVIWKPAGTAVYSGHIIMRILKEAGLPDGVINFLPGSGTEIGDLIIDSPCLAGIHFTGSTKVFNNIWKRLTIIFTSIILYQNCWKNMGQGFYLCSFISRC